MKAEGPVATFEWTPGGARCVGRFGSLTEAQGALPAGSYTTLRTYGGRRVLRLEQHRVRLLESLPTPAPQLPMDELVAALRSVLDATAHAESRLRLTLAPPQLFLSVEPFVALPEELREKGASCITVPLHRERPHAKDTRFIDTAARVLAAMPAGTHETLMVDDDDSILEGLSSNFFAISGGELRSERERVLLGVTRSLVLEVAAGLLPVRETAIVRSELPQTTECFITSVSREVLPVTRIDGVPVGDGRPGPLTLEVARRFADLVYREARAL
jgi:branched-subunit amino acid aminotransferase/4-amino-4-deoxychorismate lyase